MVYKGTVKGGTVVLEEGVSLPEGTPVKTVVPRGVVFRSQP